MLLSQCVVSQGSTDNNTAIDIDTDIDTENVDADTEATCKLYSVNHISYIQRLLKTALRTSSSQNTGLFNMAIAMLAIHQDRRWFMGIVHLKGHARPRAWRSGGPPRTGDGSALRFVDNNRCAILR